MIMLLVGCLSNDTQCSVLETSKSLTEHGLHSSVSQVRQVGICGDHQERIALSNDGDAPLVIDRISLLAAGWNVQHAPLPLTLDPGQQETVLLEGPPGTGALLVGIEENDAPELIIPIEVTADHAPELRIHSPNSGVQLTDKAFTVVAIAADEEDRAEELTVS